MASESDYSKTNVFWSRFTATNVEGNNKNSWLELFLNEYEKFDDDEKKYFVRMNVSENISSELSKHMLMLIFEICDASKVNKQNLEDMANCQSTYDVEYITRLRSFLLDGIGGKILKTLQNIGTKNIINNRELANVLIKLFPTKDWKHKEQKDLEYDASYVETLTTIFNVKTHTTNWKVGVKRNSLNLSSSQLFLEQEDSPIRRKYCCTKNTQKHITDESHENINCSLSQECFSMIVLNILEDLIVNENILTIDESSTTINCLNFGLNNLKYSKSSSQNNQYIIRQKMMGIVVYCLNNIFVMDNIAEDYINVKSVIGRLMDLFEEELNDPSSTTPDIIKINFIFSIIHTAMIVINNTFLYFCDNLVNEKYFLSVFEILDRNSEMIKRIYSYLRAHNEAKSTKIIEISIRMLQNFKLSTEKSKNYHRRNKRTRIRSHHMKRESSVNYVCALEKFLLHMFPIIKYSDQKVLLSFFDQHQICCCNSNIKTLEIIMKLNNDEIIPKICLNFASKNVIQMIFSESQCEVCEADKFADDFSENFIKIYKEAFEEYARDENKVKFSILLKHILEILKELPFRLSEYFMTNIVLPSFRKEKTIFLQSENDISKEIINSCLMVIYNSLKSLSLFKLFNVLENIEHITELSTYQEFTYHICRIYKVAIQNLNHIEPRVAEILLETLFGNIELLTNILNSHISNLANFDLSIDVKPPQTASATYQLPHKTCRKITLIKLLLLYIEYWKTILQLLQSNANFSDLFLRRYSCNDGLNVLCNIFRIIVFKKSDNLGDRSDILETVDHQPERRSLLNIFHFNDALTDFSLPIVLDWDEEFSLLNDYQFVQYPKVEEKSSILDVFNLKKKLSDIVDSYFKKTIEQSGACEESALLVQNNYVKKKLAVIFELKLSSFLLICSKDAELGDKMKLALLELKKIIICNAFQNWSSIENGKNVMNALQSLLKVAEIKNIQHKKNQNGNNENDFYFPSQTFDCNINYNDFDDVSSTDESYTTADDGYDGDIENNNEIYRIIASNQDHNHSPTKINQNICTVVIEILIELSKRCTSNPESWTVLLSQMILKLNVIRAYLGGSLFLIKGFAPVLDTKDFRLRELQSSILELITDLNTPDSFSAYVSLLSLKNPPLQLLLSKLIQLFDSYDKVQSFVEVNFPSPNADSTRTSTCDFLIAKKINYLREHHRFFNLKSPFSEPAKIIPLNYINFYPWHDDGFTASMWLNINGSGIDKPKLTHLLSVGTEKQILSIYIGAHQRLFVKISSPEAIITPDHTKLYFENRVNVSCCENCAKEIRHLWTFKHFHQNIESVMPVFKIETPNSQCVYCYKHLTSPNNKPTEYDFDPNDDIIHVEDFNLIENRWTFLCIAAKQLDKKITVCLTLDGVQQHSFDINNPNKVHISTNLSVLCVANKSESGDCVSFSLSNVSLFRKYFKDPKMYANLYAMGPNCMDFTGVNTDNVIPNVGLINHNKLKIDDFETESTCSSLQKYLAGIFSSHKPDVFIGYSKKDGTEMQLGTMSFASNFVPKDVPSLQKSILLAGGISVILFTFARVVELSNDSELQSSALNLALKIAHCNTEFYTEFIQKEYINLIGVVLKNKKCKKDVSLLNSIFEIAFDCPVLMKRTNHYSVIKNSNARVRYPDLLIFLLQHFSIWVDKDEEILNIIFDVLTTLVRDKHPAKSYNCNRLSNAGIIPTVLDFCRVNFVIPSKPIKISRAASDSLVALIPILSEYPPKIELLNEIMNLLLLMHRPTDSYVTHDRYKFYFNLAPYLLSKPNKNSENKQTQRLQIKERKIKYSQVRKILNLNADSDEVGTNSLEITKKNININEKSKKPTQQLKSSTNYERINTALANVEIKKRCRKGTAKIKVRRLDHIMARNGLTPTGKERLNSINLNNMDNISKGVQILPLKYSKYLSQNNFETGNDFIQESFLNILRNFLLILPDNQAEEFFSSDNSVIEILLILSNNSNLRIRMLIINLLSVITDRLSTNSLNQYTKMLFWHHLGNQIGSHSINMDIVNACYEWIIKSNGNLYLDTRLLASNINVVQKYGINVLLAILPQTTTDYKLFSATIQLVECIYLKVPDSCQYMLENGLICSLVKTVVKINENLEFFNRNVCNKMLEILTVISYKSLISANSINILWDLMNGLTFAEKNKLTEVVQSVRNIHALLYKNLLQKCIYKTSDSLIGHPNNAFVVNLPGCNLSQTEMKIRFNLLFDKAIQFIKNSDPTVTVSDDEIVLVECLMGLALSGNARGGTVIIWSLIPARPLNLKLYTIQQLCHYLDNGNYLSFVCDIRMLKILAQSVLLLNQESIPASDVKLISQFCNSLDGPQNSSWNLSQILEEIETHRLITMKDQEQAVMKSVYRNEQLVQYCTETAMLITRNIVEKQNKIRKILIIHLRRKNDHEYYKKWNTIVQNLTHEDAPWYNSSLYPNSWEVEYTEGTDMIHKRLRRCHMEIDKKFLLSEFQSDANTAVQLLSFLKPVNGYQDYAVKDQVLYTFIVKHITINFETEGECIITDSQLVLTSNSDAPIVHNLFDVTEILTKRHQHCDAAVEIFMKDGNSLFIVFKTTSERETFVGFFDNLVQNFSKQKVELLSQKWRDGEYTNWEYLMMLNQISGRTFHDLMQYPVFPWILSDYESQILNLLNENVYRNLEKPIAVQHKDLEKHYINNYNYLKQALNETEARNIQPYHYSSHYSNSGTVLHFLVRMLPFTSLFLQYQDDSFDIPDRTFHSLNTTWLLASKDSPTDVKELVPEFFCFPEFLENLEGFNFGNRQSGEPVDHVFLPPWCQNSSRLFTLIHRQALESDCVRKNINNWIDLIFGYKQTGQAAIDSLNVFHPATYCGFTAVDISDPVEKLAFETMVKTYGQMPRQIFDSPHPSTNVLSQFTHISVLDSVIGLKWGLYTGSPVLPDPQLLVRLKLFNTACNTLHYLKDEDKVYGFPERSNIIKGNLLVNWNEIDDIIRIKPLDAPQSPSSFNEKIVYSAKLDPITTCGTDPYCSDIWFGHKSGRITVYQPKFMKRKYFHKNMELQMTKSNTISSNIMAFGRKRFNSKRTDDENENMSSAKWSDPTILIKHRDEVTGIKLSTEYKIVVSVSFDGTAAIWDLNRLEYIREIPKPVNVLHSAIILATISPTMGDIVTVHANVNAKQNPLAKIVDDESFELTENNMDDYVKISMSSNNCQLRLYTINAKYVNHIFMEDNVSSLNYSYVKEGAGVNVIVVGFDNGLIRFFSSWNLALVREINLGAGFHVKSLFFTKYQYLIALTNDNVIQVWKSDGLNGNSSKFPQTNFII